MQIGLPLIEFLLMYFIFIGENLEFWINKKQYVVVRSSIEAEQHAIVFATSAYMDEAIVSRINAWISKTCWANM